MIGTTIGNYRVTKLLGKGGMGAVYEAQHVHINRRVALKLLLPQFVETPDIVQRFVNEALAVNTISHPGIVQVSDQGRTADGGLYMVMELLEGETLGERSKRLGGRLSESSVVRIGAQVASALAAAHEKQIIHRDIKPGDSISMCSDGEFLRKSGQGTVTEAIVAPRPTASSLVQRLGIWARRSWVQTTCWCCAGLARWHQDHW